MASVNIKKPKEVVFYLLQKFSHLRDSDEKLIATIWRQELLNKGFDLNNISAMEFLKMFADGKLTNYESVGRCRRKIQQENADLRGETYKDRQEKTTEIKEQLKN